MILQSGNSMKTFKAYFENKKQHDTFIYVLESSRNFEDIKVIQLKGDLDIADRWVLLGSHNNKTSFEECLEPLKRLVHLYVLRQEKWRKEFLAMDPPESAKKMYSISGEIYNRILQAFEPYKDYPGVWRVVNASPSAHLTDAHHVAFGVEVDAEYIRTLGMRDTFNDTQDNIIDW